MLRGFLAMGAAALVALVALTDDARAGGCAGCGTVLASPQASEQAYAAPQGEYCAPTVYCEEEKGCCLTEKLSGLGCKLKGAGHGLKCKMGEMGHGLKCKMGGLKCKLGSLGHKCHAAPVYETCGTCETMPSPQWASPQGGYAAPQGPIVAAPQFPSGQ